MNQNIRYKDHTIIFKNLLTTGENVDKKVRNGNLYETPDHNFDLLLNFLKPGNIVYDIGAYIGSFSIPMALEGMKVHAFEGFPDNFERLRENCGPYESIVPHPVAVSNEGSLVTTKFNDCRDIPREEREITYVVLDDYLKEKDVEKPDFIKLDIEGMETVALWGMKNLLENVRPIWQIGYHVGLDVSYEGYPGFVKPEDGGFNFNRFPELGYKVYNGNIGEPSFGYRMDDHQQFAGWGEYICIPEEKIKRKL